MKAFILAAGLGTRLAPYTKDKPKGLLTLGPNSLIGYSLRNFRKVGITHVYILTGYMAEQFKFHGVKIVHNNDFAETNMVTTLFCAEEFMTDEFIISWPTHNLWRNPFPAIPHHFSHP